MEVARGGILREGLGYDRNDVAVVTNVAPDHLGHARHRHPRAAGRRQGRRRRGGAARRLRRAQRRRRARAPDAPPLLGLRRLVQPRASPAARCATSSTTTAAAVAGRSCSSRTDRGDMIVIRHGRRVDAAGVDPPAARRPSAARPCSTSPTRWPRPARRSRAGAGLHDIRQGLRTFTTSYYLSPGRMNQINVHNVDVIVDYCHNAAGMRVLGEFVERYAAQKAGADRPRQDLADRHDRDRGRPPRRATCASSVRSRRSTSTSSSSARTSGCAAGSAAFTAEHGRRGRPRPDRRAGVRCRQVEIVLDETDGGAPRHGPGQPR